MRAVVCVVCCCVVCSCIIKFRDVDLSLVSSLLSHVDHQWLWAAARERATLKEILYGWLHRSLLGRYKVQSAMNCSTLRERAAGSSPNNSRVSLHKVAPGECGHKLLQLRICMCVMFVRSWQHIPVESGMLQII